MKMINNKLTGRGTAMIVAAPSLFAVSEAIFHANPIVGGAVGVLAGIVAYRHWDDADAALEALKAGTLNDYEPRAPKRSHSDGGQQERQPSQRSSRPVAAPLVDGGVNQLIPIGKMRNQKDFARSLKSLKNIIILGLQGGGKSNTAIHVLKHAVRNGARLAIIDKHARAADDSLSAKIAPWKRAFICPVAGDPDSALQVVEAVRGVLDERLDGEKPTYPLILVVDEYSAIMRQKEDGGKWRDAGTEIAGLIEDIVTEGRKCQIFVICIGQITNVSRTGGSEIRELFPTRIAHGMSAKQAQLFGFNEQKNLLAGLGKGEIFIQAEEMAEPLHLQVRYETDDDIRAAASRIPEHEPIEVKRNSEDDLDDDNVLPLTRKPRKSKAQEEQEFLERGIAAYEEGATTLPKLAAKMGITEWAARKLMAAIEMALAADEKASE